LSVASVTAKGAHTQIEGEIQFALITLVQLHGMRKCRLTSEYGEQATQECLHGDRDRTEPM